MALDSHLQVFEQLTLRPLKTLSGWSLNFIILLFDNKKPTYTFPDPRHAAASRDIGQRLLALAISSKPQLASCATISNSLSVHGVKQMLTFFSGMGQERNPRTSKNRSAYSAVAWDIPFFNFLMFVVYEAFQKVPASQHFDWEDLLIRKPVNILSSRASHTLYLCTLIALQIIWCIWFFLNYCYRSSLCCYVSDLLGEFHCLAIPLNWIQNISNKSRETVPQAS